MKFFFIYHFLVTGEGDVTFNQRRGILGAVPVGREIAFHLYNFTTSKAGNIVKLIRKSSIFMPEIRLESINNFLNRKLI